MGILSAISAFVAMYFFRPIKRFFKRLADSGGYSRLEVLKMRGAKHEKKIVAMQIVDGKGIEIFPEQEVFGVE